MSKAISLILTILLLGVAVWASSDVVELSKKNFKDVINGDIALVEFYAPWCGHCKQLAPILEKVATTLKADNVVVAKVDATKKGNAPFNEEYGIEGFPTLLVFKKGKAFPIQPERTEEGIVATVKRFMGSAVRPLASDADLEFSEEYVVVGFFGKSDETARTTFATVAESLRADFTFAEVTDEAVAAKAGVSTPAIVAFRKFDEPRVAYSGDFSESDIKEFIATNSLPVVGEITQQSYPKYAARSRPWAWLFLDQEDTTSRDAAISALKDSVKGIESKFNFVYLDGKRYGQMAKQYGLSGEKLPALAIESEGKHYILEEDQELNSENLRKTFDGFLAGTLPQKIRSQAVPESNDGPVKVVVATTFSEIVLDDTKDVLVEFYAPWCGHCQKLAPTYEKLGAHFAKHSSVVIAKIDGSENDIDSKYGVEGFPTLMLFPAGKKDAPVTFNDQRDLETLIKFVKDNASIKIADDKDEL